MMMMMMLEEEEEEENVMVLPSAEEEELGGKEEQHEEQEGSPEATEINRLQKATGRASIFSSLHLLFPVLLCAFFLQLYHQVKMLTYARTLFGRRRYLPSIRSVVKEESAKAKRQALNFICQGLYRLILLV